LSAFHKELWGCIFQHFIGGPGNNVSWRKPERRKIYNVLSLPLKRLPAGGEDV
jgi:hypothetical protein